MSRDSVKKILIEYFAKLDKNAVEAILAEPKRIKGLLLDLSPASKLEINLLFTVLQAQIPLKLLRGNDRSPCSTLFNR